jgi:hypothetical protein
MRIVTTLGDQKKEIVNIVYLPENRILTINSYYFSLLCMDTVLILRLIV